MSDSKDDDRNVPEPFNVIFSPLLYHAIKYNQAIKPDESYISDEDLIEFEKFKHLFKEFLQKLNKHDQSAFSSLSNLMNMWGYSRKYCGMCGKPVIGKGGHIQNRLVCPSCHSSYRITEELYKREVEEKPQYPSHNHSNKKDNSKNQPES